MVIIRFFFFQPIEIISLPASNSVHEDRDSETYIHGLIVYDYNYESEDNMTCRITNVSPNEINLFELKHNGGYAWNCMSNKFHKTDLLI